MPIFARVFARLQEDDGILAMADRELLEVELSWALSRDGTGNLSPVGLLQDAAVFVRRLHEAAGEVAGEPYLPDLRNPNGPCRFRRGGDVVVAFHGDSPVWYWRRQGGRWELHMMRATREPGVAGTPDLDALLDELEYFDDGDEEGDDLAELFQLGPIMERIEDFGGWADRGPEPGDGAARHGNDPERLTPDALLGVIQHFTQVLKDAHEALDGAPLLPDAADPGGEGRFRSNGEFIVAYRAGVGAEYAPVWCWRRKPDGRWRLYRLRGCAGPEIPDPSFERRLREGDWN